MAKDKEPMQSISAPNIPSATIMPSSEQVVVSSYWASLGIFVETGGLFVQSEVSLREKNGVPHFLRISCSSIRSAGMPWIGFSALLTYSR